MIEPFGRALTHAYELSRGLADSGLDAAEVEVVDAFRRDVARFCAERFAPGRIDRDEPFDLETVGAVGALGLFGLTVPESYGGGGLSMRGASRIVRELARFDGSIATTVGLHAGLALRALLARGSEALLAKWLPDLATGRKVACFCATEPEAGSDVSAVRTTARPSGDGLVLDGEKIFVTNGGFASVATVLASTPGLGGAERGHSLLLVDLGSPGVRRGREEKKLGLKGSSTVSIHFEGVHIPVTHVLGEAGRGMEALSDALSWGRTFLSAGCLGTAEGALDAAAAHVATRRQFGRPLAGFELVRSRLASIDASAFAMESLLGLVTALEDRESGTIGWESSVAKVFCSESAWQAADASLQLHGGIGFVEETGAARRLRDSRVTRIFEGANDVLRLHVAAAALSWPREELSRLPRLHSRVHPDLAQLATGFDESLRETVDVLLDVRRRHGARIFERQVLQASLADALIALYVLLATILRTNGAPAQRATARCALVEGACLETVTHALERARRA